MKLLDTVDFWVHEFRILQLSAGHGWLKHLFCRDRQGQFVANLFSGNKFWSFVCTASEREVQVIGSQPHYTCQN